MCNGLEKRPDAALEPLMKTSYPPVMPELDLSANTTKIPLSDLSTLGVAFQPLTAAIQTVVSGGGGSGLYYVNTKGMQMFSTSEGYIGSLKTAAGTVGGGQARMTALPCDPTMLFMAVALMGINQKLDNIQEAQKEILAFLEEKERAVLQGNLNALNDIMNSYKFNWDNDTFKTNKHILVQQIKKESEASIILYRDQIAQKLKKRSLIHVDQEVNATLKKLQTQLRDYQLALYLYAYSTFLEVMLLGNFEKDYLDSVEQRISEYTYQYRSLYTDCYNLMEEYSKSSIQSGVLGGLAVASKLMGEAIAKAPVISKSQLDENLIKASGKLNRQGEKRTTDALLGLIQNRVSVTLPFIENLRSINDLHNKPTAYLFDGENIYIQQEKSATA